MIGVNILSQKNVQALKIKLKKHPHIMNKKKYK